MYLRIMRSRRSLRWEAEMGGEGRGDERREGGHTGLWSAGKQAYQRYAGEMQGSVGSQRGSKGHFITETLC